MNRQTVVVVWTAAIVLWAVICAIGWFVATRNDYAMLAEASQCFGNGSPSQSTDERCAKLKPSDVQFYKASIDRKARISRVFAGLSSGAAIGQWFLLGRPGLNRGPSG